MFLSKTLKFHSASFHPGVKMSTGEFTAGSNSAMEWHPLIPGSSRNTPSRFMLLKN